MAKIIVRKLKQKCKRYGFGEVKFSEIDDSFKKNKKGNFYSVPQKNGVYVAIYDGKDIKYFRRFHNDDEEKIMYIGSGNLRNRIRPLYLEIYGKGGIHSGGWTFFRYKFKKALKPNKIKVIWGITKNRKMADNLETDMINSYVRYYLDKPPLNISLKRMADYARGNRQ